MEKSFEVIVSYLRSEFALVTGAEKNIEKLERTVRRIRCTLVDAEERRHIEDESVKLWLVELKAAVFDAEDILDRYHTILKISNLKHYFVNTKNVEDPDDAGRKRKFPFLPGSSSQSADGGNMGILQRRSISAEIAAIDQRLEEIAKGKKNYRLRPEDGRRRVQTGRTPDSGLPPTVSYVQPTVIGREEERGMIVAELIPDDEGTRFPVILVYGVPGVGKTTVAQLVYNYSTVLDYFDMRIWVSVPEVCDVTRVVREIIEFIKKRRSNPLSLDVMLGQLRNLIDGRKFLLVLDNLWEAESNFWENLQHVLSFGGKGSKVLVTSRSTTVCKRMPALCKQMQLEGLKEDDCWILLRDKAFPRGGWEHNPNLEEIGRKIVSRCQGSPLAAKSLGAVLFNETDEGEWTSLHEEMWALRDRENDVQSSLMISYHHLNYQLKQCFAYCSVFPNGHEIDKDELVRLWIAEGLVQLNQPNSTRRLEAIGSKYFDELSWRSFFEVSGIDKQKYRMPSLIHDLARLVSKIETVVMEDNLVSAEPNVSKQARYASLIHRNQESVAFHKLYEYASLRAVVTFGGESGVYLQAVPSDLPRKVRCLRVLDLSHSQIESLPDSVGELILLRYLGLTNTKIKGLPESVCSLYNLQTIELSECNMFLELPKRMSYLVNLRHIGLHLDWDKMKDLLSMPHKIDSLASLETLTRFTVTSEGGCNIGELKDLKLRGELCISKLEHVLNEKDAEVARLKEKQYINKLMLRWTADSSSDAQWISHCEEVAKRLSPHKNIKCLGIENYPGRTFPGWLGEQPFSSLETMVLSCCRNCLAFPLLGHLPCLKNLHIKGMDSIQRMEIAIGFPALEMLTLKDMPNLEKWCKVKEYVLPIFPKLQKVVIMNCSILRELPQFSSSVKMEISNSPGLRDYMDIDTNN